MSEASIAVVAVGNALVDVLSKVDDAFLDEQCKKYGMEKGAMTLIDEQRAVELYTQMPDKLEASGGSAANTMAGFASFGGVGAFVGKVADDTVGQTFKNDMNGIGVKYNTQPLIAGPPTGRCMILVAPDGHRTMNTFLGASVELSPNDIDRNLIFSSKITYLEGYLFDRELAKQAFITAAEYAHQAGHRVALTLSDPFCVDRHRHDFLTLVEHHVDILFANEEEIKSLYMQQDFKDAKSAVDDHCEIAVLTRSEHGAVIVSEGKEISVSAAPVKKVVDTTGAGDQFAAGFLYGFTHGRSLEESGKLGALAAAEVISHIGPRPLINLKSLLAA
ncbi:MAG: adenosine kinase [Alphaproteobacteria bacterium]|nr:adenosine kinase [Alphaproteobacteria bacterium]MCB9975637.1 adenosine kinase [Rhodospirillales bacterium]